MSDFYATPHEGSGSPGKVRAKRETVRPPDDVHDPHSVDEEVIHPGEKILRLLVACMAGALLLAAFALWFVPAEADDRPDPGKPTGLTP